MRNVSPIAGYTLLETLVALLLFTIGGLALAGSSAVIGRELRTNAVRERATRIAANRLEILGAQCRNAAAGSELEQQIQSDWSVSVVDSARVRLLESVTYLAWGGARTDSYRALVSCP